MKMNMKRVFHFIMIAVVLHSCGESPEKEQVHNLNFEIKSDIPFLDLSEYFNCNPIVLKTSSNDSIMIGQIDKVIVHDSLLYMSDSKFGRRVFVYDFDGNLKHTIGTTGKGPGEYIKLTDFDLVDNHIYLLDGSGCKIIKFDLLGRYVNEICLSEHGGQALKCLPNNKFFTLRIDGLTGTRIFNEKGERISETIIKGSDFLSYSTKKAISYDGKTTVLSTIFNDTIYELKDQGTISPLFYMNFKDRSFPISQVSNNQELAKTRKNRSYVTSEWIVNTDDFILIEYVEDDTLRIGYYLKNEDKLIRFLTKFKGIPLFEINGQYGDQIIFSTESFYVKKWVSQSTEAPEILKKLTGYESPVLFFLKPKK